MRILILTTLYPPIVQGGAEKAAALLAEALARSGDQVAVVSLHPGAEQIVEERNGVRVYRVPLDNVYWPFDAQPRRGATLRALWHLKDLWNRDAARRVGEILDLERPEVMHTHGICGFSVAVWKQARRRGVRVIHTTHDYYLLCLRSDMFPGGRNCDGKCLKCRLGTLGMKYTSNKLDAVISVSGSVLARHQHFGYFKDVFAAIGHNISPEAKPVSCREAQAGDELVFGFIGRVEEQKGIQIVLAACSLLANSNWRLRIAGSGRAAFIGELKRQYPDVRIEWLGYVDSETFYHSIDVVIVASVWADPLPYVTIEALEHGKSMIAARSGGISEIAALGRVVETYPAEDVSALARIMDRALEQGGRWRAGGFSDAATARTFSAETIVRQHRERYTAATQATPSGPSARVLAAAETKTAHS